MIVVSIVSHNNERDIIEHLKPHLWADIDGLFIQITDNVPSHALKHYCSSHNISYKENILPHGFGRNNNLAFEYVRRNYPVDNFICLNPDIRVSAQKMLQVINEIKLKKPLLGAPKLANPNGTEQCNIRPFPTGLSEVVFRFLTKRRTEAANHALGPLWASGAFLVVAGDLYEKLGGFDERYYMYYEDVDFCTRALIEGVDLTVIDVKNIVHIGA